MYKWEDNTQLHLKETVCEEVEWTHLNAIMNFQVPKEEGNLTSRSNYKISVSINSTYGNNYI
jgi:hypothetical protein